LKLFANATIRVQGIVQGVGFRPFVWQMANACQLVGSVRNDADGVLIRVWGHSRDIESFLQRIEQEAPPLANIDTVKCIARHNAEPAPESFRILHSKAGRVRTDIAADSATCSDCLREILDSSDRRFGYPFTNCTHCGPRLSIVRAIPYDRANTSMAAFPLCARCQAEYENPADRRFHAQPNACPDCGPQLWLEDSRGRVTVEPAGDSIRAAARLLQKGRILAIKGIGGIHLACDASCPEVVERLRQRKGREGKAFALMARDPDMVRRHAHLDDISEQILSSVAAPIVILPSQHEELAPGIAPGQDTLGFMLPYSPLHHLLMREMTHPVVLTSANSSEEPQCISNTEARKRLAGIADYLLLHDRGIVTRLDDSVVRVIAEQPRLLRRARGYAPQPIPLPAGITAARRVLAMGAELKSTFCLVTEQKAIVSQHLGNLENAATWTEYRKMLEHYQTLYDFRPELIVVDKHPGYLSTQFGKALAAQADIPLLEVQHHHAHIAACMAEHRLDAASPPVLGIVLDGLGYGDDVSIWGAEFLLADYQYCERLASIDPIPLIGGSKAMREPWRNTYAWLNSSLDWEWLCQEFGDLELMHFLQGKPLRNINLMIEKGINSPLASSAGRLFDAVAGALNICREGISFEGQAAIELESLASRVFQAEAASAYTLNGAGNRLHFKHLWLELLKDLQNGVSRAAISARFHHGLSQGVALMATKLCQKHNVNRVILSGGVFQNKLLLEAVTHLLEERSLQVMSPMQFPANDGGISLGQAVMGAAR